MKSKRIFCWFLVAFWMGIIFFFSSQPAEISGEQSGGLISFLLSEFLPGFELLTHAEQLEKIEFWQHTVRKLAHFFIYAVLGMLCLIALYQHPLKVLIRQILAVVIASLYAVSDEIHQFFVPGRSCEIRDVCIDGMGALTGVMVLALGIKFISIVFKKSEG